MLLETVNRKRRSSAFAEEDFIRAAILSRQTSAAVDSIRADSVLIPTARTAQKVPAAERALMPGVEKTLRLFLVAVVSGMAAPVEPAEWPVS